MAEVPTDEQELAAAADISLTLQEALDETRDLVHWLESLGGARLVLKDGTVQVRDAARMGRVLRLLSLEWKP